MQKTMTRWTITLVFTAFLASTVASGQTDTSNQSFGQLVLQRDTTYITVTGDSLVQKGDTTYIFFKNGCLKEKGIFKTPYLNKPQYGRWVGKYYTYYEHVCSQVLYEYTYSNKGSFISQKYYDEKGKLVSERKGQ